MKRVNNKLVWLLTGFMLLTGYACQQSFLEVPPAGSYSEVNLLNKRGIEGMLINAYASLDGNIAGLGFIGVSVGASNWIYGSIVGGDAYKGGINFTDQGGINDIMQFATPPSNPHIDVKWNSLFDGIGRANQVLKTLPLINDPSITAVERKQIEAEARFIRAFQHFEAKKVFGNIPFVDETATDYKIPNTDATGNYANCWPQIEADFKMAYENLDEVKGQKGRVNKWAAGCYLAKAYLYEKKFLEAKGLFDIIIAQGRTTQGAKYELHANYGDNFRIATQNGKESVLEVQMAVGDGATTNGFQDAVLTYPNGIAGGTNSFFFRPSQNCVNTFRTDERGLPLLDTYNNADVTSFETVPDDQPFTPYTGNLDPRLDHTVGRRGIPYLDWGMMTGVAFTAPPGESITNGGPYCQKKWVFSRVENSAGQASKVGWGFFSSAMNYVAMRYADVLLMAAECEVEIGSLERARSYVNLVRARAAASAIKSVNGSTNAANYVIGQYTLPWANQADARRAVRFERRLELAQEGHRFFDLVRWGTAEQFINNEYLPREAQRRPSILGTGVRFTPNRSEYQPIPIYALTQSNQNGQPTLRQNPGY